MDRTILLAGKLSRDFMDSDNHICGFDGDRPAGIRSGRGIRKMYLAAFTALLMCLSCGLCSGYSAPATYDMQHRPHSAINPTEKEIMWIGSIVCLGVITGSLIAGPLADKIGRKDTLIYNIVIFTSGWIFICYANKVSVLLVGRFLCGTAVGVVLLVVPMYCVEISTPEVRGILGSGCQGFLVIGNFISVLVGAYVSWRYLALQATVVSILSVIAFMPMPESPRWLIMKNNLQGAIASMKELQGTYVDPEKECKAIYEDLSNQPKGSVTWEELKHPTVIKPALITTVIMFIQQFSGINAVFIYSTSIFDISKELLDPKMATIIVGAVQIVATLISNFLVDKSGRKILLIISGVLMSSSFALFGFFYYKITVDTGFKLKYDWIPLTSTVIAVIGYSFGYGPIPFLLSAEMLPVRVRSTVSAIVHIIDGFFVFIVTNNFSDMENLMTTYGTFWFYSSISALGILFVIFFVPETKGKHLEEIQELFHKKRERQDISIPVLLY